MSNVRIVIVLLLLLSGNHVKAQFNTVSCPGNRYKATVENPTRTTNETEATPESITSENEKSVPDKVSLSSADTKKEEQVARYLSVCYPLSHIKINSPYGYRKDPFTGKRKFHNGIDLYARNAEVYAMLQGQVIAVGQDNVSGKYVTLQHGNFTVSYCLKSPYHKGRTFCRVMLLGLQVIRGAAPGNICISPVNTKDT